MLEWIRHLRSLIFGQKPEGLKRWKKEIEPKIKSAHKVQAKWLKLSDDDWDKEIDMISNLTADEFLDFIRADFTVSKIVKLATHHPMLAVRQLFNIIKGA